MSTKAPLPPDYQPPLWATREFRRLLIVGVMGASVIGVLVFDIAPKFSQKPVKAVKAPGPDAYVPRAAGAGEVHSVKYEGVLEKVKDGSSIDDQDESYQYLVRSLSRMDPAQLAKDAKAVDYSYYSKLSGELRGQTAKVLAMFLQSNPIRVDGAPGGVNFIHRTYLMDLSGDEGYVVDLLEAPGELEPRTLVGLDAVFLKLGTYESKRGLVQAPLFVGKSLRVVKERISASPVAALSGGGMLAAGAVAMLLILGLTTLMFRKPGPKRPAPPQGPSLSLETLKT
ncbi:MAG TPA: hypothetical protein VKU80_14320 [Planctomycetota bacterium]|nr:hypothetical protein [Planctomycetota bacterium]